MMHFEEGFYKIEFTSRQKYVNLINKLNKHYSQLFQL